MTQAQIQHLDNLPSHIRMTAEIVGRDGVTTALIQGGKFIQRDNRPHGYWWVVTLSRKLGFTSLVTIRECDRVVIEERRITVRK